MLCLRCATPVRGAVYGEECLRDIVGEAAIGAPQPQARRSFPRLVSGVGFAIAILGTASPWKRFGLGSGPFGAYGVVPRWSWLAVGAAAVGVVVWVSVALRREATPGRVWRVWLLVAGALVVIGSAASIMSPPGFGPLGIGPFASLLGGAAACAGSIVPREGFRSLAQARGSS